MSVSEYVSSLMLTCPHITVAGFDMHIDQLEESPTNYSIDSQPAAQVVTTYLNGDTIRRFSFMITARKPTMTDSDRSTNNATYEAVGRWMEGQTRKRLLPPMSAGQAPQRLVATGGVYLAVRDEDADSAVYSMQAELIYYQKGA